MKIRSVMVLPKTLLVPACVQLHQLFRSLDKYKSHFVFLFPQGHSQTGARPAWKFFPRYHSIYSLSVIRNNE